jgi:putative DNA primase/helicase
MNEHNESANDLARKLLSGLFLEDSGSDSLALVRQKGVSESTFPIEEDAELYSIIASKLGDGLRDFELAYSIKESHPRYWPRIQEFIHLDTREPTCQFMGKYADELLSIENIAKAKKEVVKLNDEVKKINPDPNEIYRLGLSIAATSDRENYALIAAEYNTDTDASLRFAQEHKHRLRYCKGLGWLAWDKRRWAFDGDSTAIELSKKSARSWLQRAAKFNGENSNKRIKAALDFESAAHVKAAVELAKSDAKLAAPVDELDAQPWKLNVCNGTIDLKTGTLSLHNKDDLLTKLAPVKYSQNAKHEILDKYLDTLDKETPGMSAFLARCFGAALTGDASPETLFILQGDGGSGKTTLVEAIAAMLGDYAVKLPFQSFCQSKYGRGPGSASPDLIALRGTRLAYASEGDQAARLDSGVIKMLTGNEPIAARALYSAPIVFPQTFKLWLVSNYDPKASSDDTGMWRRMMKIPFAVIPENLRDPEVKKMLTNDPEVRSALLSWTVKGCLDWQKRGGGRIGLAQPEAIKAATEAYHIKQDSLAEWWDDLLSSDAQLDPFQYASAGDLRQHYDDWCPKNGIPPVHGKRFAQYLESKGLQQKRRTGGERTWDGIKMIT